MDPSIYTLPAQNVFSLLSVFVAVLSVFYGAVSLIRYFWDAKDLFYSVSTGITAAQIKSIEDKSEKTSKPFEAIALANYYNQALSRANISFWFSIIFASIGFGVIIFAFISHRPDDIFGTIIKVASGTVIDAVSGLFFLQSNSAQRSMGDFFEKLRLDRLNAEAREMIAEIENIERRDQLRSQLILKYSNIDKLLTG